MRQRLIYGFFGFSQGIDRAIQTHDVSEHDVCGDEVQITGAVALLSQAALADSPSR